MKRHPRGVFFFFTNLRLIFLTLQPPGRLFLLGKYLVRRSPHTVQYQKSVFHIITTHLNLLLK